MGVGWDAGQDGDRKHSWTQKETTVLYLKIKISWDLIFPSLIILIFSQFQVVCYSFELEVLPLITGNQSSVQANPAWEVSLNFDSTLKKQPQMQIQ